MNRRLMLAAAVALFVAFGAALPTLADDKQLQNVKGSVSFQLPNGAATPIGINATVTLADKDYAITGNSSLAQLTMPDSSQVMVGADSKVQLAFFNAAQVANAKFVLYDGRVRFAVRHPAGAKANYTFTTPTGSVGVRGTQGDIQYDPNGSLRVNVYEVCDPNYPVVVTTKGGRTFTLAAGQTLAARLVNGIVQAQVEQLTQALIDQFNEFGVPTSWDQAQGRVVAAAQNQASGAVAGVPYGQEVVSGLGSLFKPKKTPTPSPAPKLTSCS